MTETTRQTDDLQVDDLEVTDGPDPLTDGGGPADAGATPELTTSGPADGEGPDVGAPTVPDPSLAEVQAKTGAAPDLSVPKPPATASPQPAMTVEQVREAYTVLGREYDVLREERGALDVKMTAINKKMQIYQPYIVDKVDPQENQHGIIRYIKTQNEIRKAKAEKINTVLQGLKLADVLSSTVSKLDSAMSRKNTRGAQRPHHPQQTLNR